MRTGGVGMAVWLGGGTNRETEAVSREATTSLGLFRHRQNRGGPGLTPALTRCTELQFTVSGSSTVGSGGGLRRARPGGRENRRGGGGVAMLGLGMSQAQGDLLTSPALFTWSPSSVRLQSAGKPSRVGGGAGVGTGRGGG